MGGWLDMSAGWYKMPSMGSKAEYIRNRSGGSRRRYFLAGFMDGLEAHLNLFSFSDQPLTNSESRYIGSPVQAWTDAFKFIHYGFEGIASDVDETGKQQRSAD